jgi:hypothetical protein
VQLIREAVIGVIIDRDRRIVVFREWISATLPTAPVATDACDTVTREIRSA